MIVDLPATTIRDINKRLIKERDEGGAVALGRVLTLVIDAGNHDPETAIHAANEASRENPCRIIVLTEMGAPETGLNAELRLGGDAGASEVIVLRHDPAQSAHADTLVLPLLLPDTPIVAWWPYEAPDNPANHPVGKLARRRITDSTQCANGRATLARLARSYTPGDTDLAWTRSTLWRGLTVSALDLPPYEPVTGVTVKGEATHPSLDLLQAWFSKVLNVEVQVERIDNAPALTGIFLERPSGTVSITRPDGKVARINQPGQPEHTIPLPIRPLGECIAEELRRLDSDDIYGEVLKEIK